MTTTDAFPPAAFIPPCQQILMRSRDLCAKAAYPPAAVTGLRMMHPLKMTLSEKDQTIDER